MHQLGLTLNKLNRLQEAFERFQESLQITERIGDRATGHTLMETGKMLLAIVNYDEAIKYFNRTIEIDYELNNPVNAAISLETIGITFEQQRHFQEALEKYQEALQLAKQYSSPQYITTVENHIARVKLKLGRYGNLPICPAESDCQPIPINRDG